MIDELKLRFRLCPFTATRHPSQQHMCEKCLVESCRRLAEIGLDDRWIALPFLDRATCNARTREGFPARDDAGFMVVYRQVHGLKLAVKGSQMLSARVGCNIVPESESGSSSQCSKTDLKVPRRHHVNKTAVATFNMNLFKRDRCWGMWSTQEFRHATNGALKT